MSLVPSVGTLFADCESQPMLKVFSPTAVSPVRHHFSPPAVTLYVGNWSGVVGMAKTSLGAPVLVKQMIEGEAPVAAAICAWVRLATFVVAAPRPAASLLFATGSCATTTKPCRSIT